MESTGPGLTLLLVAGTGNLSGELPGVRVGEAWPGRAGLVSAARATTAGGDESYDGDRRDQRENSDCDPGFSADSHRLSPFVQKGRS
jgi:hypothetical protein